MTLMHRLQNSLLTHWLWRYWRNEVTGQVRMYPLWVRQPIGWVRLNKME